METKLDVVICGQFIDRLGLHLSIYCQVFSKHHQKKEKNWVTAEILDLYHKRRELRKNRFKPEGSKKYKEVNNNIKRCMKNAKENWLKEQCSETEDSLRKLRTTVRVREHTNL